MAPTEIIIQIGMTAFSVILTAGIGIAMKRIMARYKEQDEREAKRAVENEAMKNGMRAILRDRIIQADIRFTNIGYIGAEQKENINLLYEAYHQLGGNGVVTTAYNHLMSMPLVGKDE